MGYAVADAADVEAMSGVFRPIRRELGVTAFGINLLELPPSADSYANHDHAEDGQEEVYCILEGDGRIVVDGEEIDLRPGRFVFVGPESKRQVFAGEQGVKMIVVGSPPGAYQPRQG